jgi:hypothetical protein
VNRVTDLRIGLMTSPEREKTLACFYFVMQSDGMESNWAAEHLQTIRTLMERSAIYRRALAPIMLFAGTMGVAAAVAGLLFHLDSMAAFGTLWLGTAAMVVVGAFLVARQQALKDREPFWSPPTRRVAQALLPPLLAGLCMGGLLLITCSRDIEPVAALIWVLFYGCALHAAGFFMPRGIRWFGWIFILSSCGLLCTLILAQINLQINGHWFMGFFFGGLHLAYGAYLYLTEKKNSAT